MRHLSALFAGSCLVTLVAASPAGAQSTASPAAAPSATSQSEQAGGSSAAAPEPQEVIVTATRHESTVNKVPMSIAAETQKSLDAQGIKSAQDLTRIVPSLSLINQTAGVATFAIRGIVATTGAATTGVYLDDTSVTKRNNAGVAQNNGAPAPILFDLDRVEVLKGPQGTLYGGSSQGGTIRYITPTPSLSTYSGLARAEVTTVENGSLGHEIGFAVGGPIVPDTLGFRVSAVDRYTGGWIDVVSPYTNQIVKKDANDRDEQALRGALRWDVTRDFRATLSAYHSSYINYGGPDSSTDIYAPNGQLAQPGQTYTTPATCYNNSTRPAVSAAAPTAAACPAGALPTGWFMRQAQTYGPWNLAEDQSLAPYDGVIRPARTITNIGSVTLDYALDAVPLIGSLEVKSITSYIHDSTSSDAGEGNDPSRLQTTLENPGKTSFPLFAAYPVYSGRFLSLNRRHGVEEELRLSSTDPGQRLTWVLGMYYSHLDTHIQYHIAGDYDPVDLAFYGLTSEQRYSIPNPAGNVSFLDAQLVDTELAGFGEANFAVTSKLAVTAGVRVSQVGLKFAQANWGQLSARPDASAPYAFVQGRNNDTPVTPKYGIQYQLTPSNMLYFNAAEGFRAGGVNVPLNPQVCSAGLALFGLTVNDIPASYGPDTVWSYELGGKFRLLDNRLQLNVAAYQIDWSQIQVTTSAQGCGQNWNQNGGTATSRGFDLQAEFRPIRNLSFNAQAGYTDAHYTEAVLGPKPTVEGVNQAVTFNKGDPLGVPTWQAAAGVRYDHVLFNLPAYLRLDYQFVGAYTTGSSFGTGNYSAFTREIPQNDQVNLRAGIVWKNLDISAYANNLLDSRQRIGNAGNGQTGCAAIANNQACTTYVFFNPFVNQTYQIPRTVGAQANYSF